MQGTVKIADEVNDDLDYTEIEMTFVAKFTLRDLLEKFMDDLNLPDSGETELIEVQVSPAEEVGEEESEEAFEDSLVGETDEEKERATVGGSNSRGIAGPSSRLPA